MPKLAAGALPKNVMEEARAALTDAELQRWTIEVCTGCAPFTVVASSTISTETAITLNSVLHCTVRLNLSDGPWWAGASVLA